MTTDGGSIMLNLELERTTRSRRRGRPSGLVACVVLVTVAVVAVFAAMALAAGSAAPTVGSASNAKFAEKIVVDAHGRTLYALHPETTHHLLCKSSECLKAWPPLTVRSSKTKLVAGSGVHGHLGILRRSNGMLQVTLGGLPLYHFSGDSAKGAANGEDIKSFGGTWHVIAAATDTPLEPAMAETTPSSPSTPTTSTPATPTPTPTTPTTTTPTPTTPTPAPTPPPAEKYGY
jgi:predicted lipoprotein with Yx(FWY)xxD motif